MPDTVQAPSPKHGTAELRPGVRLHHVTAGNGPRTVVLLHGYPQAWQEWDHFTISF